MLRQLDGARQLGQARQSIALNSPDQDAAVVAKFMPQVGAPDYDDQLKRFGAIQTALTQKAQQISADPAAYVLQNSPKTMQLWQDAQNDPTKLPLYAASVSALQDQLGVPPSATSVLPVAAAQSMAKQIMADPEKAPATLAQLQSQWGSAWPTVWRDLTTAKGGLPAAYQAVGMLPDQGQAALLARGLAEQGKSGKNLVDLLPPKAKTGTTGIDDMVQSDPSVTSLLHSISVSGGSSPSRPLRSATPSRCARRSR